MVGWRAQSPWLLTKLLKVRLVTLRRREILTPHGESHVGKVDGTVPVWYCLIPKEGYRFALEEQEDGSDAGEDGCGSNYAPEEYYVPAPEYDSQQEESNCGFRCCNAHLEVSDPS